MSIYVRLNIYMFTFGKRIYSSDLHRIQSTHFPFSLKVQLVFLQRRNTKGRGYFSYPLLYHDDTSLYFKERNFDDTCYRLLTPTRHFQPLCIIKVYIMYVIIHHIFSYIIVTKVKVHYDICRFLVTSANGCLSCFLHYTFQRRIYYNVL